MKATALRAQVAARFRMRIPRRVLLGEPMMSKVHIIDAGSERKLASFHVSGAFRLRLRGSGPDFDEAFFGRFVFFEIADADIKAVVEAAHLFATEVLKPGGAFVAKVLQGSPVALVRGLGQDRKSVV